METFRIKSNKNWPQRWTILSRKGGFFFLSSSGFVHPHHCITASLHHWPQLAEEKLHLTGRMWKSGEACEKPPSRLIGQKRAGPHPYVYFKKV
jgi:hypothetical protein